MFFPHRAEGALANIFFAADRDQGSSQARLDEHWDALTIAHVLSHGETIDLSSLSRDKRLEIINTFLEAHDLRALEGLGDATKGQIEFVGINRFTPDKYVARVDFQAKVGASGDFFNHLVFFSAHSATQQGVIVIPIIECVETGEKFLLLVKEWRAPIGRLVTGFVRGFPDVTDIMESKPIKNALKELNEETGLISNHRAQFSDHQHIADVIENSGSHNVVNAVISLHITVDRDLMKQLHHHIHTDAGEESLIQTILVKPADAFKVLEDQHSLAALAKWFTI